MNKADFENLDFEMIGFQKVDRISFTLNGEEDSYVRVESSEEGIEWYPDGYQFMHGEQIEDEELFNILEELFSEYLEKIEAN